MDFKTFFSAIIGLLGGAILLILAIVEADFWLGLRGILLIVVGIVLYFLCKRKN